MSRLFALLGVAVIAFLCAPHPVKVTPTVGPVEEAEPILVVTEEPANLGPNGLRLDPATDWSFLLEWEDRRAHEEAMTADNLGRPCPLEPEEYPEYKAPTYPSGRRAPRRFLRENGASAESERAVALGLAWIARQQRSDGAWEFDGDEKADRVAATGFALLAFLRVGERPARPRQLPRAIGVRIPPPSGLEEIRELQQVLVERSQWKCPSGAFCTCATLSQPESWDQNESKYYRTVAAGLAFLQKNCPPSGPNAGRMSTSMHEQAIATLALCKAYGMTRDTTLRPFAQAASFYLQKKQAANGGWSDTPDGPSDLTVTGWAVQALFAAGLSKDLIVDDRVIKKAIKFLDLVAAGSRKSMYGLTDNLTAKPGTTATATGLLCRYHIDMWGPSHPGMIDGVAGLAKNPPSAANSDPLFLYYATWVMARYEGEDWKNWNEGPKAADGTRKGGVRDLLVGSQNRKDGANLGSWDPHPGEVGTRYGRFGTTALNLLTLEVYYRYPPLYKRGTDGNAVKILEDK